MQIDELPAGEQTRHPDLDMNQVVGTHDILMLCFDTLRYDVSKEEEAAGRTPVLNSHGGEWEKRHAPGNFTYPSHFAIFAGFLPSPAEPHSLRSRNWLFFPVQAGTGRIPPKGSYPFTEATFVQSLAHTGYETICIGGVNFFSKRNELGRVFPGYFTKGYWLPTFGCTAPDSTETVSYTHLTAFYTVLKSADPWLRFVFITGVTKFAQMGIFSTLNQLIDISFDPQYNALCGMTRPEIEANFVPELERLAERNGLTKEDCMAYLTRMYDGYHFNYVRKEGMYNPFSILNVLRSGMFENYWFASGTPTFLAEMLKKTHYDLRELDGLEVTAASLTDDRADVNNPVPMIYQSGYLTIKGYDTEVRLYKLGYPNDEVKYGFLNFITPFYTSLDESKAPFYIGQFVKELRAGDVEAFLTRLRAFFADFPYELNDKTERHYQVVFYLVFKLLGQFINAEVQSALGRADAVVKTANAVYVFEFKLNGTAEEALAQIDNRGYLIPYTTNGCRIVKIGAEFSKEERNLSRWLVEEEG